MEDVRQSLALSVIEGPDQGQLYELTDLPATIGRHPLNSIPLTDASASRYQFRIVMKNGGLVIEDAGSLNGTYVNGEKIESAPLLDGDRIEFGNTILQVTPGPAVGEIVDERGVLAPETDEHPTEVESITSFDDQEYLNIQAKKDDFDRIYRSYYAFSALYQIDRVTKPGADLEEALSPILDFIMRFLHAERACLLVKQRRSSRLQPQVIRYRKKEDRGKGRFPIRRKLVSDALSKREALQTMRTDEETGEHHAILCAPLVQHRGLSGVLYLETTDLKKPFSEADLQLFSALAFKAGSVLENAILYRDLRDLFFGTVETLVDTIQEKDRYTSGHSRRVAHYSSMLGAHLKLAAPDRRDLRLSAVLHDIGKVGWPDRLLHNEDDLTPDELEQVQAHPKRGADLLERLPFMDNVIPGIRYHHEAWDGSGYPMGMKGEEIPLFARIIAVADTFDAVTTDRPYQKRVEFADGLEILRKHKGTRLDPELVEKFIEAYPRLQASGRLPQFDPKSPE